MGIRQNIPFSQKKQKKEFEKSVGILSEKNKKTDKQQILNDRNYKKLKKTVKNGSNAKNSILKLKKKF